MVGSRLSVIVSACAMIVCILLASILYGTESVSAAGGVGSGGSGSGGGGGGSWGWTNYGHGWALYNTSGSGPSKGFHTGSWSTIKSTCNAANADKIAVYILGTGSSLSSGHDGGYMGYNYGYSGPWGGGGSVDGSRATKIAAGTAKGYFDSLSSYGVSTSGYTWGANVAWFCWDFQNKWTLTPSTALSGATPRPGQTATWTHNAKNNGPSSTDKAITITRQRAVNSVSATAWATGTQTGWTKSSGWGSGTSLDSAKQFSWSPTQGDDGKKVCERMQVRPRAWNNNGTATTTGSNYCAIAWQRWQVVAGTNVDRSTATPGDTIRWTHTLRNSGGDWTTRAVGWTVSTSPSRITGGDANTGTISSGWKTDAASTKIITKTYTVQASDAGQNLCQKISATPSQRLTAASSPGGTVSTANACVSVPYSYDLTPSVNLNPDGIIDAGTSVVPDGRVTNEGPTSSRSTTWQLIKLVLQGDAVINEGSLTTGTQLPCIRYQTLNPAFTSCSVHRNGNSVFPIGAAGTPISGGQDTPALGTKVCYGLAVQPYNHESSNTNTWRYSSLKCVSVGKYPKVQIWGGNLSVGKSFDGEPKQEASVQGKTSRIGANTVGSWVEYGIFAPGKVEGVASGAGLAGAGNTSDIARNWNLLTYANTNNALPCASGGFGCYRVASETLPDPMKAFGDMTPVRHIDEDMSLTLQALWSDHGNGVYKVDDNTTLTLGGGSGVSVNDNTLWIDPEKPQARWMVIDARGANVVISNNLFYATNDEMKKIRDIPQLIVVAENITIKANVKRVDAWLTATNVITTCDTSGNLTIDDCDEQLQINGPVVSKELRLRRTAGTGNQPAEIFNLRPDTYLWMYRQASSNSTYSVTSIKELPPRY